MAQAADLTGLTFNYWTVLERDYEAQKRTKAHKVMWKCQCVCGTIRTVVGADLKNNKSTNCGCKRVAHNFVNLTGKTFNYLTVVERVENKYEKAHWRCKCVCGNETIVSTGDLKNGHTTSCGCVKTAQAVELGKQSCRDLTGQQFGYLTVLKKTDERSNSNVRWLCQCQCGKVYTVAGGDLTKKNGIKSCGCMSASKGEIAIAKVLQELNLKYENEKKFDDCRSPFTNYLLRYDFYIPKYNLLIEYDGIQHFKEVKYFKSSLAEVQEIDNYKNEYAKKNNFLLLRIPYTDFNIISKEYLQNKIKEIFNG